MNTKVSLRSLVGLLGLAVLAATSVTAQDQAQPDAQTAYTMKVNATWCSPTSWSATRRREEVVRGLTANDFQVMENGKPQKIISFDFQSVDQAAPLNEATITGKSPTTIVGNMNRQGTSEQLRNHRLIVMFFDITSMQPEDLERAQDAARNYVNKQMHPADLVRCRIARPVPLPRSGLYRQ